MSRAPLTLVTIAALLAPAGPTQAEEAEDAAPSDPELSRDLKLYCEAGKKSGAAEERDPAKRDAKVAKWIGDQKTSASFKELLEVLTMIHPNDRHTLLQRNAFEQGLGICALAEADMKALAKEARAQCAKQNQSPCYKAEGIEKKWADLVRMKGYSPAR